MPRPLYLHLSVGQDHDCCREEEALAEAKHEAEALRAAKERAVLDGVLVAPQPTPREMEHHLESANANSRSRAVTAKGRALLPLIFAALHARLGGRPG